ncbi:hypothetical protein BSIN_5351 [Burkholderia singularis]|uniref:Uncharacterized protein n=1 Tax=Burkholderia singularis TaxID=1503053 RepID=A0A238GYC2_9BURK|nr:hypothetical protein BSIN_5351 [Burkholderia singularis]
MQIDALSCCTCERALADRGIHTSRLALAPGGTSGGPRPDDQRIVPDSRDCIGRPRAGLACVTAR